MSPKVGHAMSGARSPRRVTRFDGHPRLLDWVVAMHAQGLSERTITGRRQTLIRVAEHADIPPDVLRTEHIVAFLAVQQVSQSTRASHYSTLKAWFVWLIKQGDREDNPMLRVPKGKVPRRRPRPIESEHLEKLLNSRMHRRTRTMILLAAYQGFRVHEIAKIRGEDIDLLGARIYVKGKGGVDEWLPLHPIIAAEARGYGSKGYWFTTYKGNKHCDTGPVLPASVSTIVGNAMARAGVPGTAHALRHWYGTQLVRAGVDSRVAQELLRHASLATTQIYVQVADESRTDAINHLPTFS